MLCHREKLSSTPSTNDSRLGFAFEDMMDELFATSESTIVQSVNFSSAKRNPNGRKGSTGGYRRSKVQGSLRLSDSQELYIGETLVGESSKQIPLSALLVRPKVCIAFKRSDSKVKGEMETSIVRANSVEDFSRHLNRTIYRLLGDGAERKLNAIKRALGRFDLELVKLVNNDLIEVFSTKDCFLFHIFVPGVTDAAALPECTNQGLLQLT